MAHFSVVNSNVAFSMLRRYLTSVRYTSRTVSCFSKTIAENMRSQGASNCFLQVVGSGPPHCPPSLFLYTDLADCRYLINCGEGTQRMMMQHGMWVSKVENVFLTSLSWNSIGGVVGLTLTLRDIGTAKKVTYYGPPGLSVIMSAVKIFAQLDGIDIVCKSYEDLALNDDVMSVRAVPIQGRQEENMIEDTVGIESVIQGMMVEQSMSSGSPKSKRRRHSGSVIQKDVCVAYLFKMKDRPGNIIVEKAISLGLPPGPAYADLKKGFTVKTQDGKDISPTDVLTPTVPGPLFIVLECPSEDYMESLENLSELNEFQQDDAENVVTLMVHITPSDVFNSIRYQTWMSRFGKTTDHMIMNEDAESHGLVKSKILQTKLNMIHPQIFPNLKMDFSLPQEKTHDEVKVNKLAECLLKYNLRPLQKWDRSSIPTITRQEIEEETSAVEGFTRHLQEYVESAHSIDSQNVNDINKGSGVNMENVVKVTSASDVTKDTTSSEQSMEHEKTAGSPSYMSHPPSITDSQSAGIPTCTSNPFPQVVFLGTGSALPSNSRNVSSILLHTSVDTSILLDCGEGTLGQLYRHYGTHTTDVLQRLQCIYVSHLHADHHMGLINLLLERQKVSADLKTDFKPLNLVVPTKLITWLNKYNKDFQPILTNISFVPCKNLLASGAKTDKETRELCTQLQLSKMETVVVNHFSQPYGVAVTHRDGWKLVYSGDTMPCHALIDIGQNADLLIHEGTFEEGLEEEAFEKRHSTIPQAVNISKEMNAGFLLLTHFSQRYPKIPVINVSDEDMKKIGIAFDQMEVNLGNVTDLPKMLPVLQSLFAESLVEMEVRKFKRSQKLNKYWTN